MTQSKESSMEELKKDYEIKFNEVLNRMYNIYCAWELGVQAGVEECTKKDDMGNLVYKNSWVCNTSHGERIK